MSRVRSAAGASVLVLALALAACGDAPTQAPAAPPQAGDPELPPIPVVEVFDQPRLFAALSSRTLNLTLGTRESEGALLLNRSLPADAEALGVLLENAGADLAAGVPAEGEERPVLQVRAEPATSWQPIGALLALALRPPLEITQVDLRLPWDETPKEVQLVPVDVEGHPLAIAFTFVPAEDGRAARWTVRVGASSAFSFHADFDPRLRKLDEPAMQGLRSALQGFARTWTAERRRIELTIPSSPAPSYINVLTVIRICGEKQFDQLTLRSE